MLQKFNVTNDKIRNVKRAIEASGYNYDDTVATSEEESLVLNLRVQLGTSSTVFELYILKDNKVVATAKSPYCLPLDAVYISGGNNKDIVKELKNLSARFLRQLEIPIALFAPSSTPVSIPEPKASSPEEADLYSAVQYLYDELNSYTPKENARKFNVKASNRLLYFLLLRNSTILNLARQRSISRLRICTILLEGISTLSLENTHSADFHVLDTDELVEKKNVRWSKLRYRVQRKTDTAIYCHIEETDNLCLKIYFAAVSRTSNTNFDIKRCIVKTINCSPQQEKPNASGRIISPKSSHVHNRIQQLFVEAQSETNTVPKYFSICTELLYYVGKIRSTSLPKYKTSDSSYVDVFPLVKNYLHSVLLGKNPDSVWVYRFKNMAKIQEICPSFEGIVPFLNIQI